MVALKIKLDKSIDNVETKKLLPLLKTWIESQELPVSDRVEIDEIEFVSRDGFSAFDHNRGGLDLISFTTLGFLVGSGEHFKTSIEKEVNSHYMQNCKEVLETNPNLVDGSGDFYNILDEYNNNEYEGYAFRIRVMYEGNNTLVIHTGWDFDAPYYRWSNASNQEITIKFKNKTDLKKKLKKVKVKF